MVFAIEDDPHVDAVRPHRREQRGPEFLFDDRALDLRPFESPGDSPPGVVRISGRRGEGAGVQLAASRPNRTTAGKRTQFSSRRGPGGADTTPLRQSKRLADQKRSFAPSRKIRGGTKASTRPKAPPDRLCVLVIVLMLRALKISNWSETVPSEPTPRS